MDGTLTITQGQLEAALRRWEQDHRDGKTLGKEETMQLSVEEVAARSSAYLWEDLGGLADVRAKAV